MLLTPESELEELLALALDGALRLLFRRGAKIHWDPRSFCSVGKMAADVNSLCLRLFVFVFVCVRLRTCGSRGGVCKHTLFINMFANCLLTKPSG